MDLKKRMDKPMDRRSFLKGGLKALGLTFFYVSGLRGCLSVSDLLYKKQNAILNLLSDYDEDTAQKPVISEAINFIEKEYGVSVHFGEPNNISLSGENASLKEIIKCLSILITQLAKYPPEMIKKQKYLSEIYLVNSLSIDNGLFSTVSVSGVSTGDRIVLSLEQMKSTSYFIEVIHHEFFHALEKSNTNQYDTDWRDLNKECKCGLHYQVDDTHNNAVVINQKRNTKEGGAFLNNYASTSPWEDRAVFAGWMFDPEKHKMILSKIAETTDTASVLRKKYSFMKRLYYSMSDGKMDEEYWGIVIAANAPTNTQEWSMWVGGD